MPRLVLARRLGESIQIGEGIVVTVVGTGRRRTRLLIEAPPEVRIIRAELAGSTAENTPSVSYSTTEPTEPTPNYSNP
ncbi:MAG: carbon storage regulator [Thermoguttaceae bacterium]|nr:carbon storage regulator [Thermoguttaceae bacterium]MDW8038145.1 carbon storage regulator [Thermoguttaceae bacterium]